MSNLDLTTIDPANNDEKPVSLYDIFVPIKEVRFKCSDCGKNQKIKIGIALLSEDFSFMGFDKEVMCKKCSSHNYQLKTKFFDKENMEFVDIGIIKNIEIDNKKMKIKEGLQYLEKKARESDDMELKTEYGMMLELFNKYPQAIKQYKKILKKDPHMALALGRLCNIYWERHNIYSRKKSKAKKYFLLLEELYKSGNYKKSDIVSMEFFVDYLESKIYKPTKEEQKEFKSNLHRPDIVEIYAVRENEVTKCNLDKEKIDNSSIPQLCTKSSKCNIITEDNLNYFKTMLIQIEECIYDFYKEHGIKDADCMKALKNIRDNIDKEFDISTLEGVICFGIKQVLCMHEYSVDEVKLCIRDVLKRLKSYMQDSKDNKVYMKRIVNFFEKAKRK